LKIIEENKVPLLEDIRVIAENPSAFRFADLLDGRFS
jgi:hypothetical protein